MVPFFIVLRGVRTLLKVVAKKQPVEKLYLNTVEVAGAARGGSTRPISVASKLQGEGNIFDLHHTTEKETGTKPVYQHQQVNMK